MSLLTPHRRGPFGPPTATALKADSPAQPSSRLAGPERSGNTHRDTPEAVGGHWENHWCE
jgi:hypothetical protein